jgi:uncharacterized protein with NRDE domain
MCLIAFAYNKHPKYRLILAANRDEFYGRPTRHAQFWNEDGYPEILGGKDLEAGGTWMGVSKSGKWAALTNYRDPNWKLENPPSRGELVLNFLLNGDSSESYLDTLHRDADKYIGYNILLGDSDGIIHFSNYDKSPKIIGDGLHGVSNALLDTPWPKLELAKSSLAKQVEKDEIIKENLFSFLNNDTQAPDEELPETGIPYKWEKAISSLFIKTENYGTRCSSILLIDHDGNVDFTERRFIPGTHDILEENTYSIPV